jgi:hypothetical protein
MDGYAYKQAMSGAGNGYAAAGWRRGAAAITTCPSRQEGLDGREGVCWACTDALHAVP